MLFSNPTSVGMKSICKLFVRNFIWSDMIPAAPIMMAKVKRKSVI